MDKNIGKNLLIGDDDFMATRIIQDRSFEKHGDKTFEKLSLGKYTFLSYRSVQRSAEAVGCSFRKMNLGLGSRIAIFAETRVEWFIAAMGALQQRICVCTVYSTLAPSGIQHALNETEVDTIVTSSELITKLIALLPSCPKIKNIIVMEDQLNGKEQVANLPPGIEVSSFEEFSAYENIDDELLQVKPEPEDVAIIMYTSGSTGVPKGVELTHGNIMTSIIGYSCQVMVQKDDRYLAFLPLAHIMELVTELALVSLGVKIYYSTPHTMTSSSPKMAKGNVGDAKLAKPTVMNAVPLLVDRIIKGVVKKVNEQSFFKRKLFFLLAKIKPFLEYIPWVSNMVDRVVFDKVRAELGGMLKIMVVGGAPLSAQSQKMFRAIFGVAVQVGYASTETASATSGVMEGDNRVLHCGHPVFGVNVRLCDWDEGNYRVSDRPHPRGELVVGGPSVARGYFKLDGETEESFFTENNIRWFRTGDIAQIDNTGCITIIDRKKDLVKLKHGEYISLGSIESKLKTLGAVDNICLFADSTSDCTVAVVVPDARLVGKMVANGNGRRDSETISLLDISGNESVKKSFLKQLQAHGKKCGLNRFENPADIYFAPELWTPENGLVTTAFKLRRQQLWKQYKSVVGDMYCRLSEA